jgi:hypothetical protein
MEECLGSTEDKDLKLKNAAKTHCGKNWDDIGGV